MRRPCLPSSVTLAQPGQLNGDPLEQLGVAEPWIRIRELGELVLPRAAEPGFHLSPRERKVGAGAVVAEAVQRHGAVARRYAVQEHGEIAAGLAARPPAREVERFVPEVREDTVGAKELVLVHAASAWAVMVAIASCASRITPASTPAATKRRAGPPTMRLTGAWSTRCRLGSAAKPSVASSSPAWR